MTSTPGGDAAATTPIGGGGTTILRQPVVHPDRSVYGYAVRVLVGGPSGAPLPDEVIEPAVETAYRRLDLTGLAADRHPLSDQRGDVAIDRAHGDIEFGGERLGRHRAAAAAQALDHVEQSFGALHPGSSRWPRTIGDCPVVLTNSVRTMSVASNRPAASRRGKA